MNVHILDRSELTQKHNELEIEFELWSLNQDSRSVSNFGPNQLTKSLFLCV